MFADPGDEELSHYRSSQTIPRDFYSFGGTTVA
jgi:hypothetical protein